MPNAFPPSQIVDTLSTALAVLAAMITPALLISAAGMFILSTSNRLGRVVDRTRVLGDKLDALLHDTTGLELYEERKQMLMDQLRHQSRRASLLQRTLSIFYVAAGIFVLTSVAIGLDALFNRPGLHWMPVMLGLSGAVCLLYGSVLLVHEAQLAIASLRDEIQFMNRLLQMDPHNVKKPNA